MESTQVRDVGRAFVLNGYEGHIVNWAGFAWVCISVPEEHPLYGKDALQIPTEMIRYVNYAGPELPGTPEHECGYQDDGAWWFCSKNPSEFIADFSDMPYLWGLARCLTRLLGKYDKGR